MADFVGPSSLPAPVQEFFNTGILSTPTAQYIHNLICRQDMMPEGSGRKMRYARYNDLPSSTTPLDGFNDGPPVELTRVDIDAQVSWYGQYGYVSEQVIISNQDPVLNAFALRFGVSLRKSEDELIRNKLATTLSSVDCVNGTNGDLPTEINIEDVADAIETLVTNNAWTIEQKIKPEMLIATAPVRDAYIAIVNSRTIKDLERLQDWNPKWNYPASNETHAAEWGAVRNLRVFVTSAGYSTPAASANNQTVYKMFIAGLEAAGIVKQSGATANFIYRPREFSGALAQSVTLGWKMATVPVVLDDLWVIALNMTTKN